MAEISVQINLDIGILSADPVISYFPHNEVIYFYNNKKISNNFYFFSFSVREQSKFKNSVTLKWK